MKNYLTDCTSDEAIDLTSIKGGAESAQAEVSSLWQRSKEKVSDWLVRAERRVTNGFRVPPNGG